MAKNATQWLASVGGAAAIMLPKGLCPICAAATGGLLTSLGLGFVLVESNVRWILSVSLSSGLLGLGLSARHHRRWWPVLLGAVGAVTVMVGRFLLVDAGLYGGMVPLMAAMGADLWARRHPVAQPIEGECTCGTSKSSLPVVPAANKPSAT
jgi:hypothetical protein